MAGKKRNYRARFFGAAWDQGSVRPREKTPYETEGVRGQPIRLRDVYRLVRRSRLDEEENLRRDVESYREGRQRQGHVFRNSTANFDHSRGCISGWHCGQCGNWPVPGVYPSPRQEGWGMDKEIEYLDQVLIPYLHGVERQVQRLIGVHGADTALVDLLDSDQTTLDGEVVFCHVASGAAELQFSEAAPEPDPAASLVAMLDLLTLNTSISNHFVR